MANQVYATEVVTLQDGTDVTLRPLAIGPLRKFMNAWSLFKDVDENSNEDAMYDIFVQCAGIALSKELASKVENRVTADGVLTEEYQNYLEEVLDMDTIYRVLDVCGGLKLNDPKLLEAALRAAQEAGGAS